MDTRGGADAARTPAWASILAVHSTARHIERHMCRAYFVTNDGYLNTRHLFDVLKYMQLFTSYLGKASEDSPITDMELSWNYSMKVLPWDWLGPL